MVMVVTVMELGENNRKMRIEWSSRFHRILHHDHLCDHHHEKRHHEVMRTATARRQGTTTVSGLARLPWRWWSLSWRSQPRWWSWWWWLWLIYLLAQRQRFQAHQPFGGQTWYLEGEECWWFQIIMMIKMVFMIIMIMIIICSTHLAIWIHGDQ